MLEAVQSHPAGEAAVELRLFGLRRAGRGSGDSSGEFTIARRQGTNVRAPLHECEATSRPSRGQVAGRAQQAADLPTRWSLAEVALGWGPTHPVHVPP